MPDVSALRQYARAAPDTTEQELSLYMEAAQTWLENAGVPRLSDSRLYDLVVYMLATHWMDNRGAITEAENSDQILLGVMSIMHQLRSAPENGGDA